MKRALVRDAAFALTSLAAAAFPSLAAVSPDWDLATVRRQADRAASLSGPVGCADNAVASPQAEPLFTAGFMSDTHVDPSPGSCDRVRAAYELFKAKGVSLIANLGDIADRHYPEAYQAYRQVRESVYPDAADFVRLFGSDSAAGQGLP